MRKVNLKNYEVEFANAEGVNEKRDYKVKEGLINLLMHPLLKLNGRDLLLAHKLANKIEDCKEENILLEDVEYSKLSHAIDVVKGFTRSEVELVSRIVDAETVKVEEKK